MKNKNFDRIRNIFKKYIPMLYSIAAYFAIFISINADVVGFIIGGSDFDGAYWCILVMALYPIHQTYGQLSGSLYYSTDRTSLYKNIGGSILLAGMPLSLFLISDEFGMNLGGLGLALKMVLIQLIQTNILLYYNTKFLKTNFRTLFIISFLVFYFFF